ncbi:Mss4-like protein [Rhodocollybia butyracea]|uniref:Mss4-like protein n=1 Tax=Rhodocollybia butyracea TaxID=206335 RepID=A0A9P5UAU5_9AGAR|nr:Mss4-like protein [Rhodocollybia butyracea]
MKTYSGNCHCGLVKYTINLEGPIEEQNVTSCNCSHCSRNGSLYIFVPKKEMKYFSGETDLKGYSFGDKNAQHKFCPQCGSSTSWHGIKPEFLPGIEGVNIRMLNDVDISKLKLVPFDGRTKVGGEYEVGKWYEEKEERV